MRTASTGLVRGGDCVARLGGDEFAIMQTGVAATDDVGGALRADHPGGRRSPFELLGNSAFVGVSIGVAIAPDAGIDRAELMRKADIALYRAKREGRNRFRVFSRRNGLSRSSAAARSSRSCARRWRPAISSSSSISRSIPQRLRRMVGVEALLRWNHPEHGLIAPGVFMPIAEESGLIHAIGDWVLREACKAGGALAASPHRGQCLAGAVPLAAICRAGCSTSLRETGMEPGRLELEITESVLLDSAESSVTALRTLRAAGIRIALDDFGTGYSSLTYLQKYPVDKIKIDRSFVQNLGSDAASDAIVQAIVDLARAMGVEVTAEGVETAEQRDVLKRDRLRRAAGLPALAARCRNPRSTRLSAPPRLAGGSTPDRQRRLDEAAALARARRLC